MGEREGNVEKGKGMREETGDGGKGRGMGA